MALPGLTKEWQFDLNVNAAALNVGDQHLTLLLATVNSLIGFPLNPWEYVGDSDSADAGLDGSQRWETIANLVNDEDGNAHSWCVLRNVDGLELCIDLNDPDNKSRCSIIMSISEGFTGGTTTDRPTAVDEVICCDKRTYADGYDVSEGYTEASLPREALTLNVLHSTDGKNTMAFGCAPTQSYRTWTQIAMLWIIGDVTAPCNGWDDPRICVFRGRGRYGREAENGAAAVDKEEIFRVAGALTFHDDSRDDYPIKGWGPEGQMDCLIISETCNGVRITELDRNDPSHSVCEISGEEPILCVGIFCVTDGMREKVGYITDFWLTGSEYGNPEGAAGIIHLTGSTMPEDGSKQFMRLGDWLIPWDGETDLTVRP